MATGYQPGQVAGGTDRRKWTSRDHLATKDGLPALAAVNALAGPAISSNSTTAEVQEFKCINVALWTPTEMISYFLAAAQVGADAFAAAYDGDRPSGASADRFANVPAHRAVSDRIE